jgi:osmoprotectant transport system ATP-binding protein
LIRLENVTAGYGNDAPILDDFTVEFPSETTTAVIGPSGCGKSTVLKLVSGLLYPRSGKVLIDGEPLTPSNLLTIRRRMGYVIQDGGLFPHLTAKANVDLMARNLKLKMKDIDDRIANLLELTHFDESLLSRYPGELSGGQRQRVGLMRALMLEPSSLLLDEPLGALDPMVRSSLQDELKEIFLRTKVTVVLVTHDMDEAAFLADKIVLMKEGKIVQHGQYEEFLQSPKHPFVEEFLGAQRKVISA